MDLLRRLCRPCTTLEKADQRASSKLVECGKQVLQEKAARLVKVARGKPVLFSYSNDGTPIQTVKRLTATAAGHKPVHRTGKGTDEYLVQQSFYRYIDAQGEVHSALVLTDPMLLLHGKGAAAIFAASQQMAASPNQLGHKGISICHYTFDSALFKPLTRLFRGQHLLAHAMPLWASSGDSRADAKMESLLEWVVETPCICHHTHNALKWSMHSLFNDTEVMKDTFIVFDALRNSYGQLYTYLWPWIQEHLEFAAPEDLPSVEERTRLWTSLGMESEHVETLAEDLRLEWRDEKLRVVDTWAGKVDVIEQIAHALLTAWKFKPFSSSRWVSVGVSCRTFVAALLTGLPSLVTKNQGRPCVIRLGHPRF